MVQSTATTVDEYMTTLEPGRVAAMARVRDLGREIFTGWAETMAYGMPGFDPVADVLKHVLANKGSGC